MPTRSIDSARVSSRRLAGRPAELADAAGARRGRARGARRLDAAIAAGEAQQDLARAAFKPRLALGAEAGIQGEEYGIGDEERYVLASLVLRWNAFRGGADRAALREARALTEELRATRDLAAQQVRLDVQRALEDLERRGRLARDRAQARPTPPTARFASRAASATSDRSTRRSSSIRAAR